MAMYEEAVEIAAQHLKKKEEKNLKKKQQNNHYCVKLQVEEGKFSTILKSPRVNRKFDRRQGVAEKNDTERKLVKECVKVLARTNNLDEINLL